MLLDFLLKLLAEMDRFGEQGLPKTDWKLDSWIDLVALWLRLALVDFEWWMIKLCFFKLRVLSVLVGFG
jgi:hypothetical protein